MREWHIDLCVQWILRGRGRPPPSEWQVDLGVLWITARPKGRPLAMTVGWGRDWAGQAGSGVRSVMTEERRVYRAGNGKK